MPSYHIWTIGCQMNQAESARLAGRFEELGYTPSAKIEPADLIVVNGCVVRQSAENRVVNHLHLLKKVKRANPAVLIAVTGCFVPDDETALRKQFPQVDYFFRAGEQPPWLESPSGQLLPARVGITEYITIMQGCNNFCSYCIVPYRRGRERSRTPEEIESEVRELVNRGAREITLLGQNVDSYGRDLPGKPDLAGLLERLNDIDGLWRLRFLTNHPKDMNDRLIEAIARLDKVCEHFNLPVQSGSDAVLQLMNRGYTSGNYLELVNKIRSAVPGIALSTDLIAGFPSETDAQFRESLNLLSTINFDTVHIAVYSTREGTRASRELEDDVPASKKKERLDAVERLQENIQSEINARLNGKVVEVLVDGRKRGKWYGRTRADKLVFFEGRDNYTGKLVPVTITATSPWSLQGEPFIETTGGINEQVG